MSFLEKVDPEVARAIDLETRRQAGKIELIASENFVSEAVLEAQGSVMTNKYAEGYPGKRYYGGCEFVDIVETLAIDRCKKLFGADQCQCPAAFRHAGEYGRIFCGSATWRYDFGNEFISWRASVSWKSGQLFR